MDWSQIQQVLRIILYTGGGWLLGQEVVDGSLFQQALGGVLAVGSFVWWFFSRTRTDGTELDSKTANVSGPQAKY